jgi:hypothetical protein
MVKFRTRKTEGRPDRTGRTPARGNFEESEGRTVLNTPRPKRRPRKHCPLHGEFLDVRMLLCPSCGKVLVESPQ